MNKIRTIVAKEIREILPPAIFFLFLFHLLGLTKAVSLSNYSFTALRAAGATIGALVVAKSILVVDALPIARLFSRCPAYSILWKTLLYGSVVLLFEILEEIIPLASKHGGLVPAAKAMFSEVSWPLVCVLALWIIFGLLLYGLVSELVRALGGSNAMKDILFRPSARADAGESPPPGEQKKRN